jgi:hypothetical protein
MEHPCFKLDDHQLHLCVVILDLGRTLPSTERILRLSASRGLEHAMARGVVLSQRYTDDGKHNAIEEPTSKNERVSALNEGAYLLDKPMSRRHLCVVVGLH